MFPAVIAVLERREREKDQRREAQLRQELESRATPSPPKLREDGVPVQQYAGRQASYPSAQKELRTLQQRAALPAIDWRRVAIGTIVSVILVSLTLVILFPIALIFVFILESAFVLTVPMVIAASIMLGTGFWVGRASAGGGFLGPAVMGSIVGVGVPLVLLIVGGIDQDQANIAWALVFFTGAGVLLASVGGWLGVRRRERVTAPIGIHERSS